MIRRMQKPINCSHINNKASNVCTRMLARRVNNYMNQNVKVMQKVYFKYYSSQA